jgi:hypothetical protein
VHGQFVSSTEYSDRDFLQRDQLVKRVGSSLMLILTPRLATKILVRGPPCPAAFLRMVWIECTGVPGALGDRANMCARRGGCRPTAADGVLMIGWGLLG